MPFTKVEMTFIRVARHLQLFLVAGLAGLLATGCSTYQQQNVVIAHWQRGDLTNACFEAGIQAEKNAHNKDAVIWRLEQGAVLRATGRYADSNRAFDSAEAKMDDFSRKAKVRLTQETEAILSNQASLDYEGRSYDGIMLNTYKALNYLALGEPDKARPELIRAYQRQQDAVEENRKRIQKAQEEAENRKEKTDAEDRTKNHAIDRANNDPALNSQLSGITAPLDGVKTYANYVNPFTVYLDGLYFLANAADASDLERAHKSFERVRAFAPENPCVKQDLATTRDVMRGTPQPPTTYVIFETGCAPVRGEVRVDIPIFLSKVSYVGVSFPTLNLQGNYLPGLTVSSGPTSVNTSMVASIDGVVALDFKNELPLIIGKTIASTVTKAVAAYAANEAAQKAGGDLGGILSSLGTTVFQFAVNISDERTWTTLPKQFQVARIPTPTDRKIDLTAPNGMKTSVKIGDGIINVVFVKSINAGVPLLVSQFKLK